METLALGVPTNTRTHTQILPLACSWSPSLLHILPPMKPETSFSAFLFRMGLAGGANLIKVKPCGITPEQWIPSHTHAHTHAHTHICTHTHMHTHTHTHTHTYAHTHAHMHPHADHKASMQAHTDGQMGATTVVLLSG